MGERFSSKSSFIRNYRQTPFAIRRKSEARLNVFRRQIREIIQHFRHAHSSAEVIKDICHRDARPPDAGFAAADARVNCDAISVVHKSESSLRFSHVQPNVPAAFLVPSGRLSLGRSFTACKRASSIPVPSGRLNHPYAPNYPHTYRSSYSTSCFCRNSRYSS